MYHGFPVPGSNWGTPGSIAGELLRAGCLLASRCLPVERAGHEFLDMWKAEVMEARLHAKLPRPKLTPSERGIIQAAKKRKRRLGR